MNYKSAAFGTAHTLRNVLIEMYKIYLAGEIILHVVKIVNTERVQHYIP